MKRIYILGLIFISACNIQLSKQQKAEKLVRLFLDSINYPGNYEIVKFTQLDTIFSSFDEDPNYKKYKMDSLKVDSIKRHFKQKIEGWSLFVTYQGKNNQGILGRHVYICRIDKEFSKCAGGSEIVE